MRHLQSMEKPLIAVVGPTASGKTGYSIRLAKHIAATAREHGWAGAEVVNADSRQLYRHMDIGTAKVTEEEMEGVAHHLLDVLEPTEAVNIAWYKERATAVIDAMHARKHVPLLVGGSMLYVSAVVDGLEPLPEAPPELRARLEQEYDADDGWTSYDRLMRIDPATGARFDKANKRYVVRALELHAMTGIPPSTLKKTVPPPYQILQFGIRRPKELLDARIAARTENLLRNGWIEEVEGLLDRGYTVKDPGMMSHGYREIVAWLSSDERDRRALADGIGRKTRAYAKRQMTWWEADERILWMDGAEQ